MNRYIVFIILIVGIIQPSFSQHNTIAGKILSGKTKKPVEFATVSLLDNELWTISDEHGVFVLKNAPSGKSSLTVYSLGYAKITYDLDIKGDINDLILILPENDLSLDEVVVTAQQKVDKLSTTYTIDRTALDHAQILNITDITGLLPGGKSKGDLNLLSDDRLALHTGEGSEHGNPSFGTAVEIDGVRLQSNSSFDETKGISTRNVSSINIESIEVTTGIPSVEYGDLSNGMVKINTRKGKSPFIVELAVRPHTKQVALTKGFSLGAKAGILNTSLEYAKSISDLESPYTAYDRNGLSLTYSNSFNNNDKPITLIVGFSGNLGGYNDKSDPDQFVNNYTKVRDNTYRGNFKMNWLLDKSWITNLELSGSVNYSDKLNEENKNKNSSSTQGALHSIEEGYYMAKPLPTGYWYQLRYSDSKPIDYSAKLKATWARKFGTVSNRILLGADFMRSGNKGKGVYYNDIKYAPTWREDRYDDKPYMNNMALYAEEMITVPVNESSRLKLTAGLRSDITYINKSVYGTVSSFSPRFNAKYILWENTDKPVRSLSVYAGWGKAVKLPSFQVLYASHAVTSSGSVNSQYTDKLVFSSTSSEDNQASYAYYTVPLQTIYNQDLKWQHNKQTEIGVEANIMGAKVYLSAFRNKTYNPYILTSEYTPYSYNFTPTTNGSLEILPIPISDQLYSIDHTTGLVTVSDKNGVYSDQILPYETRNEYRTNKKYINGSTVERKGIDWIIDFAQIQALRTSFRLDGNFYYYKGIEESLIAWRPQSSSSDKPYPYIGYYAGSSSSSTTASASGSGVANGSLSKQINANLTITTHIPKIRLVLSMKIEGSFYRYKRNLSEYNGQVRGFVIDNVIDDFGSDKNIYDGDKYVAVYPLYYSTWDDPDTKINFEEKFIWAKDNDPVLFSELRQLVSKTANKNTFNADRISSYFSANFSVTKEIGNFVSISFYATNFINTMKKVKRSWNDTEDALFNSNYVPKYYYGLSLRLKI